jgi:hypothetical protein
VAPNCIDSRVMVFDPVAIVPTATRLIKAELVSAARIARCYDEPIPGSSATRSARDPGRFWLGRSSDEPGDAGPAGEANWR